MTRRIRLGASTEKDSEKDLEKDTEQDTEKDSEKDTEKDSEKDSEKDREQDGSEQDDSEKCSDIKKLGGGRAPQVEHGEGRELPAHPVRHRQAALQPQPVQPAPPKAPLTP